MAEGPFDTENEDLRGSSLQNSALVIMANALEPGMNYRFRCQAES